MSSLPLEPNTAHIVPGSKSQHAAKGHTFSPASLGRAGQLESGVRALHQGQLSLGRNQERPGPLPLPKAACISVLHLQAGEHLRGQGTLFQSLSPNLHPPSHPAGCWTHHPCPRQLQQQGGYLSCLLPSLAHCLPAASRAAPAYPGRASGGPGSSCITWGGG